MATSACQGLEARRRILGAVRQGEPDLPMQCSGDQAWHNFRTLDSGDPVPFYLCEAHRTYVRSIKQLRQSHGA